MANVIDFASGKARLKGPRRQVAEHNQHIRASWVRQFAVGKSVMAVARQSKVRMSLVENEIRASLWSGFQKSAA